MDKDARETAVFDTVRDVGGTRIFCGKFSTLPIQHFLYPHIPLASSGKRVIFLISSAIGYELPLRRLLAQMAAAGVRPDEIWVAVSNSPAEEVQLRNGIHFSHYRGNAYEYGALLDVVLRGVPFDLAMLIHDTCHAGPRLKELVLEQPATVEFDYMSATCSGTFNIGLYSRDFLKRCQPFLSSLIGMTKSRAIAVEHDQDGEGFKSRARITTNILDSACIGEGTQYPYDPKTIRQCQYLRGIDLRKFFFPCHTHGNHPDLP
jgi:hypothetical protein